MKKVYLIENIAKNEKNGINLPEIGYLICNGISSGYDVSYIYIGAEEDFIDIFETKKFKEYLQNFDVYAINRDKFMNIGADINNVLTLDSKQFKTEKEVNDIIDNNLSKMEKLKEETEFFSYVLSKNKEKENNKPYGGFTF